MPSFDRSGFAPNAVDFYNSLLSAAKRGLMTADQVQVVWTAFAQALIRGGAHLTDAPAVWRALLDRVRDGRDSFAQASTYWLAFLEDGVVPRMSLGSSLVLPTAGAPIKSAGRSDIIVPATIGPTANPPTNDGSATNGSGGGGAGRTTTGTPNGSTLAIPIGASDVTCICCVRKDPVVVKKEPYSLRLGDAMAYGHKFRIRVETVWSEGKPKCPCNLQWFEWTNKPYQGGPEQEHAWDDLYENYVQARQREEEYHRKLERENPRLPRWTQDDFNYQPMFKAWYDAMRPDTECPVGVTPIDFDDSPRISGRGKTRVLNFLVRVSCCPACAQPCPPRQLRLSQIIVIDEQSRLRAIECEVLREGEAFVDEKGDPLPEQEPGLPK